MRIYAVNKGYLGQMVIDVVIAYVAGSPQYITRLQRASYYVWVDLLLLFWKQTSRLTLWSNADYAPHRNVSSCLLVIWS